MTKLNLGQDWELRADAANNRLLAEYTPNGTQFEMNGDGTLRPLNGGIDLGGADITNAGSVSTNNADINGSFEASIDSMATGPDATTVLSATNGDVGDLLDDVSGLDVPGTNGATDIYDLANNVRSGLIIVSGRDQSSFDAFSDLILVAGAEQFNVVSQASRGTIPRTYTRNGSNLELAIDRSGDTFDVILRTMGGRP